MADKQKTVEIIFGGVDKTGGAITSVGRNLDSLTNRVGDLTGPLANITDSILKLDTALAAAAVGLTGYAVKLSDDFDTAFGEIATLIGQPADNLRDFQAQILSYSETSTASLDQITSSTYSAISAGIDYKQSLELIAAAEKLSIAGRADLGDTTTALVSTLNAFGANASEASKYADDFFTAVQLGQTTIPELAANIGKLAPIAAAAGLNFAEMAAAIATITATTGTSTAETITGIRAAINSLLKPSAEATTLAKSLGLEFNAAALESKGFAGVLKDVAEKTGGNTETIAKLFGSVEALAPVLALTGNAADKFAENLLKFGTNSGAAKKASEELTNTLGLLAQTLQNNLNSALITVGSNLTDEARGIVTSLTGIFNSLGSELKLSDGVFAPILDGLEGLAQDIDAKLRVIAENFPKALSGIDLTELLQAFGGLGDQLGGVFTDLFGNIDLSTVDGLQKVLQKVVDAFTALVNVSSGIIEGLDPLFKAIGKGIQEFDSLDESTKKNIGQLLGLSKAIDTILPAIQGLAGGLTSVGTGLTALAGASGFKSLLGNLSSLESVATKAGPLGFIGSALIGGAVGYGIGTAINKYIINPLQDAFGNSIGGWLYEKFNADEIEKINKAFAPLSDQQKKVIKDTGDLKKLNDSLADSLDNTKQAATLDTKALNKRAAELVNNANEQDKFNKSLEDFTGNQRKATNAVDELNNRVKGSGDALGKVGETTRKLAEENKSLTLGYDKATGKVNSWSGTIVKSNKTLEDAATKTQKVIEKTNDYELALEKIQSNENIKIIEAKVSLDIAEVEANAEKVVALANSISKAFDSTGSLISDLFGEKKDASSADSLSIERQIWKENKRRADAFELQKKLTKAEIELIQAKTAALSKDDALIKVTAEGLTPALELIFNEILQRTQVRANEEGLNLLVGLN